MSRIVRKQSMGNSFNAHFQKNMWLYFISFFCICTGIVLGIYSVKYMGTADKTTVSAWLTESMVSMQNQKIPLSEVFLSSIKNYLPIIIGLWFLGLTIVGIPVILIINVIKGYTLGFAFSFIINSFGIKGLWISLLGVLLQNIIFIPCIIICSVFAMEFSLNMLKERINKKWTNSLSTRMLTYSASFIVVLVIMFVGFFIESYISPSIINVVINSMGMLII